jgi:hypothetical protein
MGSTQTIFTLLCAQLIVLLAQYALMRVRCGCETHGMIYIDALRRIKRACKINDIPLRET